MLAAQGQATFRSARPGWSTPSSAVVPRSWTPAAARAALRLPACRRAPGGGRRPDPAPIAEVERAEPGPTYVVGDLTSYDLPPEAPQRFDAILCAGNVLGFLHRRPGPS
ncbi:MAG: hypothetical protein R2719_08425 [Micropruina sp.]